MAASRTVASEDLQKLQIIQNALACIQNDYKDKIKSADECYDELLKHKSSLILIVTKYRNLIDKTFPIEIELIKKEYQVLLDILIKAKSTAEETKMDDQSSHSPSMISSISTHPDLQDITSELNEFKLSETVQSSSIDAERFNITSLSMLARSYSTGDINQAIKTESPPQLGHTLSAGWNELKKEAEDTIKEASTTLLRPVKSTDSLFIKKSNVTRQSHWKYFKRQQQKQSSTQPTGAPKERQFIKTRRFTMSKESSE